ncbi:MAG: hypothetical protein R3E86_13385 [Pseudomonadales bacterium]
MPDQAHFKAVASCRAARDLLTFEPVAPEMLGGCRRRSMYVFVLDHRQRHVAVPERSFEAHYDTFVLTQTRRSIEQARHPVLAVSYGRDGADTRIGTLAARVYELGSVPPPDDIDGQSPSVVSWHDEGVCFLLASNELRSAQLLDVARELVA